MVKHYLAHQLKNMVALGKTVVFISGENMQTYYNNAALKFIIWNIGTILAGNLTMITWASSMNNVPQRYNIYTILWALHLNEEGFKTWVSNAWEIASKYELTIETNTSSLRHTVKNHINEYFMNYVSGSC